MQRDNPENEDILSYYPAPVNPGLTRCRVPLAFHGGVPAISASTIVRCFSYRRP